MDLARALRIKTGESVAFTGAGGKTTAMFRLARALPPPVLLTTTTRMSLSQAALADRHLIISSDADLPFSELARLEGVTLLSGEITLDGHLTWLSEKMLRSLYGWATQNGVSLLIEADGARQLPLKAPAEHEPVIPEFINCTVVLAGLSALGNPLGEKWVHRPERFAQLAGMQIGQAIGPEALVKVLSSPFGGLKGIPPNSRRLVLLNQADTDELQAIAHQLASSLLRVYDGVIMASLDPFAAASRKEQIENKVVQQTSQARIYAIHERVAGVILAAGGSQRMGRPKQLLSWRDKALIQHVVEAALQAELAPVIVVIGDASEQVAKALEGYPVQLVYNPDWASGQSTSLRTGVRLIPPNVGAAVFLLADQPLISVTLIRALVETHASSLAPVVAPLVDGQRGNPVLFDRETFPDLLEIRGDIGGRAIFSKHKIEWVQWHDPRILLDVDNEGDYEHLLEL